MPRLTHRPPKMRKHATGQAFVCVAGRRVYLGKFGSPKAKTAYRQFVREWNPAPPNPDVPAQIGSGAIVELLAAFMAHAEKKYVKHGRQTSTVHIFGSVVKAARKMFGRLPIREFGPLRLEQLRAAFVKQGCSRQTCNRFARLAIKVFRWGVSRELVAPATVTALETLEPLRPGETVAHETGPVEPVAADVIERTLIHLSPVVAAMVKLQAATGMRPGEVCELRPCDIDRASDVWQYRPARHKMEHKGKRRIVLIGPQGQAALLPFLARPTEAFCFNPCEAFEHKLHRRSRRRKMLGEKYTEAAYRRAITRAAERAGVENWAPNRLRHSFATMARDVAGIEPVQTLLGHSRLSTTETYALPSLTKAAGLVRLIG